MVKDSAAVITPLKTLPNAAEPVKKSAKRCLFERTDSRKVSEWLHEKLQEIRAEQRQKWGFFLDAEGASVISSPDSDYIFTAVPAEEVSCALTPLSFTSSNMMRENVRFLSVVNKFAYFTS